MRPYPSVSSFTASVWCRHFIPRAVRPLCLSVHLSVLPDAVFSAWAALSCRFWLLLQMVAQLRSVTVTLCRRAKDVDTDWPDLSNAQTSRKGGMRWRAGTRRLVSRKMKSRRCYRPRIPRFLSSRRPAIPECETFVIERSLVELSACPIQTDQSDVSDVHQEKLSFHLNFLLLLWKYHAVVLKQQHHNC